MKILLLCLLINLSYALFGAGPERQKDGEEDRNLQGGGPLFPKRNNKFRLKKPFPRIKPNPPKEFVPLPLPVEEAVPVGGKKKIAVRDKLRRANTVKDVLAYFPHKKGFTITPALGKAGENENAQYWSLKKPTDQSGTHQVIKPNQVIGFAVQGECKPVMICEDIRHLSSQHNGEIWPSSITYPQCGGCCLDHEEAVPTQTEERRVHIVVIPHNKPYCEFKQFTYHEHKACACRCKVKASHCKSTQTYDPDNCRCNCKPGARKECGSAKQWSDTDCGCVCKFPDSRCSGNKEFNKLSCSCQYKVHGGYGGRST